MKSVSTATLCFIFFMSFLAAPGFCDEDQSYVVGVDDVLEVNILSPERISITSVVAPDGSINLPYIGNLTVKGMSLGRIQQQAQNALAEGYMKYPVVAVALKDSRSKKFFVYGEVIKPGPYILDDGTTVLKAISEAGGFTKFGSASRVKILRPRTKSSGYEVKKINIAEVMSGKSSFDTEIMPNDIIVVSEGIF